MTKNGLKVIKLPLFKRIKPIVNTKIKYLLKFEYNITYTNYLFCITDI